MRYLVWTKSQHSGKEMSLIGLQSPKYWKNMLNFSFYLCFLLLWRDWRGINISNRWQQLSQEHERHSQTFFPVLAPPKDDNKSFYVIEAWKKYLHFKFFSGYCINHNVGIYRHCWAQVSNLDGMSMEAFVHWHASTPILLWLLECVLPEVWALLQGAQYCLLSNAS